MKILSVTPHAYMPQFRGGLEAVIFDLDKLFKSTGNEHAILSRLSPHGFTYLKNRIKANLFRSTNYPKDVWRNNTVYRGWDPFDGIHKTIEQFNPDILLFHLCGEYHRQIRSLNVNIPIFCYIHDIEEIDSDFVEFSKINHFHIIANSSFVAGRIQALGSLPPLLMPPPVDIQQYECAVTPRYLLMTHSSEVKGIDTVLEIAKYCPDIPVLIMEGWKLDKTRLSVFKDRIRPIRNIKFLRTVDDMRIAYRQTRLLVVPSRWEEAWGRVVTEAQASGIPIVASAIGGLPEAVGDGGVLIAPDAPISAWIETVADIWKSPEKLSGLAETSLANSHVFATMKDCRFKMLLAAFEKAIAGASPSRIRDQKRLCQVRTAANVTNSAVSLSSKS